MSRSRGGGSQGGNKSSSSIGGGRSGAGRSSSSSAGRNRGSASSSSNGGKNRGSSAASSQNKQGSSSSVTKNREASSASTETKTNSSNSAKNSNSFYSSQSGNQHHQDYTDRESIAANKSKRNDFLSNERDRYDENSYTDERRRRGFFESDSRYDRDRFPSDRRRFDDRSDSYRDSRHPYHDHRDRDRYDRRDRDYDRGYYNDDRDRRDGYGYSRDEYYDRTDHRYDTDYEERQRNGLHYQKNRHSRGYSSGYHNGRRDDHYHKEDKKKRWGLYMRWFIKIFAVLFVIGIIASILDWMFFSSGDTGREPLPEGAVNETSYYTDELHWIENERELLKGMETFYDKTGVQPHLVITDNVEGNTAPSLADVEQYTQSLYQELFTDEAHLLLVFLENESQEYMTYYVVGSQAESVIDAEAGDMLLDSIDHYYVEEDMTDAAFFSHSFERAADQIMEKTESSLSTASTIIAIILLSAGYGGYKWWKRKREKEELEKQRMEEVLKQPLPTFGASEAEELAKKYQDTNDN